MTNPKPLKKYHKKAIELKYKGFQYDDIAESLNKEFKKVLKIVVTEHTIKNWFREAGTLYEAYRAYEIEWDGINKELSLAVKKSGIHVLEKNFRMTCEMLVALLGSETDNVKLGAIKEMLDRILGKARQPVDLSGSVGVDLSKYEQRLKEIRKEYGD